MNNSVPTTSIRVTTGLTLVLFATAVLCSDTASTSQRQWKQVEKAMGRSGQMQPGDILRFGMPRTDLLVTLDGVQIKPGLALGSYMAFKRYGSEAMVMGDLVLTEEEIEPVMMKLQEGGIKESAIHNHLLGESPRILYMHIASHGDALQMATAIHNALLLTKTPSSEATSAVQG